MPNEPNGPPQSGGPQAYRPASPGIPDIPLAEVEVPAVPAPEPAPERIAPDPSRQVVSNPDGTNPFGPDTPNVRDDDPKAATVTPESPLPRPPAEPLQEDQIAPDYA
jgi:hypothetical protein